MNDHHCLYFSLSHKISYYFLVLLLGILFLIRQGVTCSSLTFFFFSDLAQYEGGETKVTTLIAAATSPDNLCRMDPAWHPWL